VHESDKTARLQLLEGRRLALDSSMWEVPALTVAGQAFLLQVLTDPNLGWWVAVPVALAGVVASVAAGLSLWQQRDREVLHSKAVAALALDLGLGDPRRAELEREYRGGRHQGWLLNVRAYWFWFATLACFVVADLFALIASR
jgi:hypothetical protein